MQGLFCVDDAVKKRLPSNVSRIVCIRMYFLPFPYYDRIFIWMGSLGKRLGEEMVRGCSIPKMRSLAAVSDLSREWFVFIADKLLF